MKLFGIGKNIGLYAAKGVKKKLNDQKNKINIEDWSTGVRFLMDLQDKVCFTRILSPMITLMSFTRNLLVFLGSKSAFLSLI